jgi:tetratricopeptide (TPR) repeat protein
LPSGRLYERVEDWSRAIDTLSHLVSLVQDRRQQVELHTRIGALYEDKLQDQETAEGRFLEALRVDPNFVPAMHKLIALYKGRGDWLKASQLMIRAEEQMPNPLDKIKILFEIGTILRERLDEEKRGSEFLARVMQLDPEHVGAAEPLAELYFREGRWKELEPILDALVRKADKRDAKEMNNLYYRVAKTADSLGNRDKALKYFKMAYDLDSTSLQTLLGRADLLYRLEDWEGAFKLYQTVLVHHREAQRDGEVVEIFYRLGIIKLRQRRRRRRSTCSRRRSSSTPNHGPTLLAVIEMQLAKTTGKRS